jgi:hypothetical protein
MSRRGRHRQRPSTPPLWCFEVWIESRQCQSFHEKLYWQVFGVDVSDPIKRSTGETPYTAGFRAGQQWAAFETYRNNVRVAMSPFSEVVRWHE